MGTFLGILLLLALCGFIAYIGDLLGRRLGKKRLTLFGLRPKHTAILLTIVTGVLIAGVTFAAALLTIPGFRQAVTQGERLAYQNWRLREQNTHMAGQYATASARNEQLQGSNDGLARENQRLQGTNQELAKTNTGLAAANGRLKQGNTALENQSAGLRKRNAELQRRSAALRRESDRLARESRRLHQEQGRLTAQVAALKLEATGYKEEQYLFRAGTQVTSRVLPPNPPRDVLNGALEGLLYEARHEAGKAAKQSAPSAALLIRGRDLAEPEVRLVAPLVLSGRSVSQQAIRDWIARQVMSIHNTQIGLRLVAAENCVFGRPLLVRPDVYANTRVLQKGDFLAERRLDGSADEGWLYEELEGFLKRDVGRRARSLTILPEADENVGGATKREFLVAWDRIRRIGGPVRVVARAKQDTYRSGPLLVELQVIPAS